MQRPITLSMITADRLPGRPSILKALFCSFAVHAVTISGAHFWLNRPVSDFSIAGQRDAILVEAASSRHPIHDPVEIVVDREEVLGLDTPEFPIEPAADPDFDPAELVSASTADLSCSTQTSTVPRQEIVMDLKRPPDVETPRSSGYSALVSTLQRRAIEIEIGELEPPERPGRIRRRVVEFRSPQPLVAVQQVAGVIDKIPPDLSGNRPPPYPAEAIRRRFEGTVLLRLYIADTGQVVQVDVVKSSGHSVLDDAAAKAIRSWRGRPADRGGKPVATEELLPVRFRL